MKLKILNIFLIVILTVTIVGCKSDSESPGEKELIVGESVDFTSYEPIGSMDGQGFSHYTTMVYETLVRYENGKPSSGLAEKWENHGKEWTFHLRHDVSFTDGEKLTADVVKLNYETLLKNHGDYLATYGALSRIESMTVVDEYTLKITYDKPYYAVLQELSSWAFGILSPKLLEDDQNPYGTYTGDTAGTGAYMLQKKDCVEGQSYTFVRNNKWYGKDKGPNRFTVKIVPDTDSRLMALQSGEIDLLFGSYQITYDMLDTLKDSKELTTKISDKSYTTRNLLLNASSSVLKEKKLRQALQHAIDKEQIINTVVHGTEDKADTLFSDKVPYCDVDVKPYVYNKEKAKKLMNAAGWKESSGNKIRMKDGKPLRLQAIYQSSRPVDKQILMTVKGQLSEVGIDLELKGYETMTWFEKGSQGAFDLSINDTYGFPQDPHVFLTAMMQDGLDKAAQKNLAEKKEIDRHIADMMQTVDESKLQKDYQYIFKTLHQEAVNIPISYAREVMVFKTDQVKEASFGDDPWTLYLPQFVMK